MHEIVSRETLKSIALTPIDEDILDRLVDVYGGEGYIFLTYTCICQYLIKFSDIFGFPTKCDVEKVLLTKAQITDADDELIFLEYAETNNFDLLCDLAAYCDWEFISISCDELLEADLGMESDDCWEKRVRGNQYFKEYVNELLIEMEELVEYLFVYEMDALYIFHIKGLKEYKQFRNAHKEMIEERFQMEDCIINGIVDRIWEIMINNAFVATGKDAESYVMGWTSGSDGYHYESLAYLNPNWLIKMYVLHGLLWHAEKEFSFLNIVKDT